jgi:hypothetical protein
MKHCLILLIILLATIPTQAQRKIDLAEIQFTENAKTLLKGVSFNTRVRDNHTVYYVISNKKYFSYAGVPIEAEIEIGTQNNIVFSCYMRTDKTVITNRLLQALLAKYHQPTKKVRDDKYGKAYYWETPARFVQFMAGKTGTTNVQDFSFIHIATRQDIQTGIDPDFKHVYDLFKAY